MTCFQLSLLQCQISDNKNPLLAGNYKQQLHFVWCSDAPFVVNIWFGNFICRFFYVDWKIYPIIFNPKPETFHLNFLSFGFCGFQIISTSDDILMQFFLLHLRKPRLKIKCWKCSRLMFFIFLMSKLVKCLVVPIQVLKRKDLVALKLTFWWKLSVDVKWSP